MITDKNKTPYAIYIQEDMQDKQYGINQDEHIRGMVKYIRSDYFPTNSEMLEIAKERFKGCSNVNYEVLDYSKELPAQNADLVISALSIHHLEHEQKKNLFKSIYEKLPENGYFVNYDQFCVEDKFLNQQIEEYWIQEIINSGISETEYERWLDRKKLDRESTINEELSWLKQAGFKMTECIYSKGKFAVLLAGK